jgi:hypothetical protein
MKNMKNMKKMKYFIWVLGIFFNVLFLRHCAWALNVDEKLTARIVKVSDSKKTILINRGIEDGLVVNNHAKFFVSEGVVARGVVVKASPSRSVWSLYNISSDKDIVGEKVLGLKITEEVKLTKDVTRMFQSEDDPIPPPDGVSLADGASDDGEGVAEGGEGAEGEGSLSEDEKSDKKISAEVSKSSETFLTKKTMEFWGLIHLNSLNASNSYGSEKTATTSKLSGLDFVLGMEKYFQDYLAWYGKVSILPFLHYASFETSNIQGDTINNGIFAFGLGLNYHFLNPPLSVNRPLFFAGAQLGTGTSTDQLTSNESTATGTTQKSTIKGALSFFSVGGGMKYYGTMGLGFKIFLDYYRRVETYKVLKTNLSGSYVKTVTGPRILVGLAYRF